MKKQTRLVITGASGFIGTHLTRYFEAKGVEVHALTRTAVSLTDANKLTKKLQDIAPTHVIHAAAGATDRKHSLDFKFQYENTTLPAVTLAQSLPSSVQYAIFLGSCAEYGDGPAPFQEGQALRPLNAYAWGKVGAFNACKIFSRESKIPMCWGRPSLVFGGGQNTSYLVPSLVEGLLQNQKVPLTPGEQILDYLFIDDFCALIGTLIEKGPQSPFLELNLASGEPRKLKDIVTDIHHCVGSGSLDFGKIPYRVPQQMNSSAAMKKWNELFGAVPATPWQEAIQKTVDAYRSFIACKKAV